MARPRKKPLERRILCELTGRQVATISAALRLWEALVLNDGSYTTGLAANLSAIATEGGLQVRLSEEELGILIGHLNG